MCDVSTLYSPNVKYEKTQFMILTLNTEINIWLDFNKIQIVFYYSSLGTDNRCYSN